jgi:hypothetical protein
MARIYAITFSEIAITVAQDLFEITPADDHPVTLMALYVEQGSDMGDIQEEGLYYKIIRGHATGGSSGSTVTPIPLDPGDSAASFTAKVNNTTIASSGTPVVLHSGCFNNRAGLALILPPEMMPTVNQGQTTLVVRLTEAPADSLTVSGTLYVMES